MKMMTYAYCVEFGHVNFMFLDHHKKKTKQNPHRQTNRVFVKSNETGRKKHPQNWDGKSERNMVRMWKQDGKCTLIQKSAVDPIDFRET